MRLAGVFALVLVLLPAPMVVAAADEPGCTETAHVRWEVDIDRSTVDGAIVQAPDCADGDLVGLQLIMEDGDLPDEPLVAAVVDERAVFDLAPYAPGIEPTIGVRIMLYPSEDVAGDDRIEVIVDRRYFNHAGNEQRGLRDIERLALQAGDTYVVAGPSVGYATTGCGTLEFAEDVVGEGVGTFTATEAGRHLACFEKVPGASVNAPTETDVLGDTAPGRPSVAAGAPADGMLARTGVSVAMLIVLALLMLGVGWRVVSIDRR